MKSKIYHIEYVLPLTKDEESVMELAAMKSMTMNKVYFRDNLEVLDITETQSIDFIYIDPPFNTGHEQKLSAMKNKRDINGDRTGFSEKRYSTEIVSEMSYEDRNADYLYDLKIRLEEAYRTLKYTGNMFVHLDHREVHYVKVMMDTTFGRDKYVESIYWTWDYGARTKKKFPQKTNEILWYCKDSEQYYFNLDECDRLPYMSPALVGEVKAKAGKTPTNCFTKDTEILTTNGWKNFSDITINDYFATLNPDNHILEYQKAIKIHVHEYTGQIVQFTHTSFPFSMTPDHYLYGRKKHETEYGFIPAKDISGVFSIPQKSGWVGIHQKFITICGIQWETNLFLEFLGYFLSEGWTLKAKNYSYRIGISQLLHTEKSEKIKKCLDKSPYKFYYNSGSFVAHNKEFVEYLQQFGKAHEKYIPNWCFELSKEQLEILFDALMLGDGCYQKDGEMVYCTSSKKLSDDFSRLCLHTGYITTISEKVYDNPNWHNKYTVYIKRSKELHIFSKKHITFCDYDDKVYCVTVPNHIICVRKNGKIAWVGNCWWMSVVGTNSKERTSYPTQKPVALLERLIKTCCAKDGVVMDFYAGSGTTGQAALNTGRSFILCDNNPEAIEVMKKRFGENSHYV